MTYANIRDSIQNMITNPNISRTNDRLIRELESFSYFTIEGLSNLTNEPKNYCKLIINRWKKRGHVLKLKRGVYVTQEYYKRHIGDLDYTASVAGLIEPVSYLSLEYVLQKHNILTDATYTITSVTTKTTRRVINDVGGFYYKHIKDALFTNYQTRNYLGQTIKEAPLEKALFDYMYFKPLADKGQKISLNIAEELRLNLDVLTEEQVGLFKNLCETSGMQKMRLIYDNFKEYVWKTL